MITRHIESDKFKLKKISSKACMSQLYIYIYILVTLVIIVFNTYVSLVIFIYNIITMGNKSIDKFPKMMKRCIAIKCHVVIVTK